MAKVEETPGVEAPPVVGAKKVGIVAGGKLQFKQVVREAANYKELRQTPYGLKPALVLVALASVAFFDAASYSAGLPELLRDLEIPPGRYAQALAIVSIFIIPATLVIGFISDRWRRVPMVGIGAILGGVFSIFTTRTNTLTPLALFRSADVLGSRVRSGPASSLLADYYPPASRGKVFALYGVVGDVVTIVTPVAAGALIVSKGWRYPLYFSAPLMVIAGLLALFALKDPIRGFMERRALGMPEADAEKPEEVPSWGEAFRTIWAIRTLRRIFLARTPFLVAASIYAATYPFILFQEYSLNAYERALYGAAIGVFVLPFGFLSGGIIDMLLRYRPQRVLVYTNVLGLCTTIPFLLVISTIPPLWVLMGGFVIYSVGFTLLGPAGDVVTTNILPAHIRSQGNAVFVLAGIPANIIVAFLVNSLITRYGLAGTMRFAAPFYAIGYLIDMSAAGLFDRDMRAAMASQAASTEWRRAKDEGKGKMLVCRDVDVHYDSVQVLFGVDFDVEEGETVALLGTNGAGKSTLLRAISGTQEASAGAIVFDGRDITHMPSHEITMRNVIHMPGGRGVFPGLSVKENLELGTWNQERKEARQSLDEVYAMFPVLKERGGTPAGALSGGEQQMLSLAQAFLGKPKLLMIDELSLGLSPAMVAQLIEAVRAINRRGTAIIVVEQSVNVALTLAEKAIFMEKGEVKFIGKTSDLLQRPDILRAVYVKGTGALTDGAPAGAQRTEREKRAMGLEAARTILEVTGVSKSFGGVRALDDVSLVLREGEALGLIGPNGAGKTTLFDLICGFQIPETGKVVLDGVDITSLRPDERAKLRLVRRFQDARLFPALTVYENLLVALERKLEVRNMALTALQVPQVRQAERRIRLRADRLVELLDLVAYRDKFVRELSTGLRRITDLACVLATEPKVLLLDEPSTGIAQAEAEGLAPLLGRVRFETGCSMLIIEHDMPLISAVSDELVAMVEGRILMRGKPDQVLNDERLIEAYLGTSQEAITRSGILE